MNKLLIIGLFIIIASCKAPTNDNTYNRSLANLIVSNYQLKSKISSAFYLNNGEPKVFKVLISRRNDLVRITIYRLSNKTELQDYPSSYFVFDTNTFLCYDGSEILGNHKLDSTFMNIVKMHLLSGPGPIYDSRIIQFDVAINNSIKINMPVINPYDFLEVHNKRFPLSR